MYKPLQIILLFLFSFSLLGQDIPVGTWRNHTDYSATENVEVFGNKVFCSTKNGLFYFDTEDGSLNTLSTTNGLSSINISMLKTVGTSLLIGYEDGLLDVLDEELNITAFEDIFQSDLRQSKRINNALNINDIIYLATDFGVVLYDVSENELIDAFLDLGENGETLSIRDISTDEENLFLSTEEGLLIGNLSAAINLKDFQNWERKPIDSLGTELLKTVFFENQLYGLANIDSIYVMQNDSWEALFGASGAIQQLEAVEEELYCSVGDQLYRLSDNSFELAFTVPEVRQLGDFAFAEGQFYLAEEVSGLVRYREGAIERLIPQGPKGKNQSLHQIEQFTFHLADSIEGFSYFEEGKWTYTGTDINGNDLPLFRDVALDLTSGNGIFLSATNGLYSWDTEVTSPLSLGDSIINEWVRVAESPQASYWALVKTDNNLYAVFDPTNESLVEMNLPASSAINDYLIVSNGDHYLATNSGLFVFNPETGQERRLNSIRGNGNLPNNRVNDLAVDLSGQLWIATESGPSLFNRFQGVLEGNDVDASQPIFDGFFLFDGIPVTHIAVDGGNRKWMSTRDGLWLFDESIERNILHLRRSNSPISNNNVEQMVINPFNGELFFTSPTQFLSYRTDATRANAVFTRVEVFPNPVRMSTNEFVTIRGLAFNSEVMITDMAGNVLQKGQANGGTFSWNLSNYSGFRAKAGVYLVFSISPDGTESYRTKFAILP